MEEESIIGLKSMVVADRLLKNMFDAQYFSLENIYLKEFVISIESHFC